MAKAKASTTSGTTGTGTGIEDSSTSATPTPRKTRGPNDPATTVYWNEDRQTALLTLLYSRPGQLTGAQAAVTLSTHPAFVDQQPLFGRGDRAIGEKIRQQAMKLAKLAEEKGQPVPQLKRTAGIRTNIDNVFARALAQVGGGQLGSGQVAPVGQGNGLVGGGIPLVPVGGQAVGGLIPVPQG